MLKELKISNFRCFDDEVMVRFAPITVLIGKNNSGKSSIIKFLLMLQQSLNRSNPGFLVSENEKVSLGSFYELKNTNAKSKFLDFSLSIKAEESPKHALSIYLQGKVDNPFSAKIVNTVAAKILYDKSNSFQGVNHEITLTADNKDVLSRSKNISQNSLFLDFSDEQQIESTAAQENSDVIQMINAENACMETWGINIKTLSHILPVKQVIAKAFQAASAIPEKDVGQHGEYAMNHLFRILREGASDKQEFLRHYIKEVLGIADIDFNTLGGLAECNAKNLLTNAATNIANFGFGVSQCLPIFIQGAIKSPGTTMIVEQPEAQVHPTAQLEMGQFFADLWQERKVGSIIETHSDNILLRLRRLISNGKLGADDVTVAFFNIDDGKTIVKNLSIENDGTMEDGLPMEFFHKHIWECLEMGNVE